MIPMAISLNLNPDPVSPLVKVDHPFVLMISSTVVVYNEKKVQTPFFHVAVNSVVV